MPDSPPPSIWQRSPLARLARWLFSWRVLRRSTVVLAWTVTIIALLYAEENWRGRHAWNKYRRELEAGGAQLDWSAFIPKPVPDEQNFAATPVIKSWFPKGHGHAMGSNFVRAQSMIPSSRSNADKAERHFVDLVAWDTAFRAIASGQTAGRTQKIEPGELDRESRAKAARAVLEEFKSSDPIFAELSAASHRPYSRYPVNYDLENPWGILLPHLAGIRGVGQGLQLRACAELAVGQGDRALEDVKLMLYLVDSVKDEVFWISYLVRLACLHSAIQTIWEGLAEHRWTDTQLEELQTRLQQFDFLTDLKRPLAGERAAGILTAELLFSQKYRLSNLLDEGRSDPFGSTLADLFARLAPHGWYDQEKLNYCRLYDEQLSGMFDPAKKRVFPRQVAVRAHELERQIAGGCLGKGPNAIIHHRLLATLLLPSLDKVPAKAAAAQTAVDQAALACALERYRLANGQFPEKLEALSPRFITQLPSDMLTGEPYRYERTDDGQFILYSVGWDEKDEGGAPGKTMFDQKRGDWTWRYPHK